jgi:signal peptidase II
MATRSPSRPSGNSPSLWLWLGLALVVVLLDQYAKALVIGGFRLDESRYVTSFFDVVWRNNPGMAWSLFANAGGAQRWILSGLAGVASIFIVYMLAIRPDQKLFAFALAMILGGAVGNLIDRLRHGSVVDFISLHWHDAYTFPAFNLADSAITLGAICLILDELRRVRKG